MSCCKHIDLDDACSFKAVRTARLRDRRLGILNTVFQVLIFAYIVVLNIVLLQSYRADGDIIGTLRMQLAPPTAQYRRVPEALAYCGQGTYTSGGGGHPQLACRYDDALEAKFPSVEATSIFLTTKESYAEQTLPAGCPSPDTLECSYTDNSTTLYYLAQPGLFTMLVDHSVSAPSIDLSASSFQMDGRIAPKGSAGSAADDGDDEAVDPCVAYGLYLDPPGVCDTSVIHVGVPQTFDIMPVGSLLAAAGVTGLDGNLTDTGSHAGQTLRFAGGIFVVTINYDNYYTYFPTNIRYAYSVAQVADTEFKVLETLPAPGAGGTTRAIINRHGLRFMFVQSGRLGVFSASALLVQLVSSFGLLAVSAAIVNFLAFNVLAMRFIYTQYAAVTSVDFSDIDHIPPEVLDRFRSHDLINPRPAIFARAISMEERIASRAATGKPFTEEEEAALRAANDEEEEAGGPVRGRGKGKKRGVSVLNPLGAAEAKGASRSTSGASGARSPMEFDASEGEDDGPRGGFTHPASNPKASVNEHWRPQVRRGKGRGKK